MARYYFYDGTKDDRYSGYISKKGAIKAAMTYLSKHPSRYVAVYEEHGRTGTGTFIGRVYYGTVNKKKVLKFKTNDGTFQLDKNGNVKNIPTKKTEEEKSKRRGRLIEKGADMFGDLIGSI